jgi:hypothetical protein
MRRTSSMSEAYTSGREMSFALMQLMADNSSHTPPAPSVRKVCPCPATPPPLQS